MDEVDWARLEGDMRNERVFKCDVVGFNQGGVLVKSQEIEGFVPISHLLSGPSSRKAERLHELIGRQLRLRVIECDQSRNRVVLSERAAQSQTGAREQVLTDIIEDQKVLGEVTHITKFGIFVDIGGVEGLVHISELSWSRVSHPRESAAVGEKIEVLVMGVDRARGRVALSVKRLKPNPWQDAGTRYETGQRLTAEVTELVRYGAFARLEAGIEGLIHTSKMGLDKTKQPWDVLERGQQVEVRILSVDVENQRISLGLAGNIRNSNDDGTG